MANNNSNATAKSVKIVLDKTLKEVMDAALPWPSKWADQVIIATLTPAVSKTKNWAHYKFQNKDGSKAMMELGAVINKVYDKGTEKIKQYFKNCKPGNKTQNLPIFEAKFTFDSKGVITEIA